MSHRVDSMSRRAHPYPSRRPSPERHSAQGYRHNLTPSPPVHNSVPVHYSADSMPQNLHSYAYNSRSNQYTNTMPPPPLVHPTYPSSYPSSPYSSNAPSPSFTPQTLPSLPYPLVPQHQPYSSGNASSTSTFSHDEVISYTSDSHTKPSARVHRRCFNCCTLETSTWRRSTLSPGKVLCNKCGLFERTHSRSRPETFPHKRGTMAMPSLRPSKDKTQTGQEQMLALRALEESSRDDDLRNVQLPRIQSWHDSPGHRNSLLLPPMPPSIPRSSSYSPHSQYDSPHTSNVLAPMLDLHREE